MTAGAPRRLVVALLLCALPLAVQGQVGSRRSATTGSDAARAHRSFDRTDGFVFTRIRYGGYRSTWNHDYPRADLHLPRIIDDVTTIDARLGETNVFRLDDPELGTRVLAHVAELPASHRLYLGTRVLAHERG